MNMPTYFTLSFMIRKGQQKRSGEVPIFARLTISGQRTEFNINRSVEPENWLLEARPFPIYYINGRYISPNYLLSFPTKKNNIKGSPADSLLNASKYCKIF